MLLFLLGLLSSVACVISLARGGAFMLSAMRSQSEDGCSVAHLKKFSSQGLGAFRCEDGSLDAEHEGTVLLRHGWKRDAVEVYRMAPVYLHEDALPVAWAVAKDRPLSGGCPRRFLWARSLRLVLATPRGGGRPLGPVGEGAVAHLGFLKREGFSSSVHAASGADRSQQSLRLQADVILGHIVGDGRPKLGRPSSISSRY